MIVSKEFIRYILVGIVNTVVGIGSAFVCINFLKTSYLVATSVAYLLGIIVSYVLNKKYTFKNTDSKHFILFVKFVFTMLPSYVISYYLGWKIVAKILLISKIIPYLDYFSNIFSVPQAQIRDNIALAFSMALYLILGFSVNKFLVFAKKNKPE